MRVLIWLIGIIASIVLLGLLLYVGLWATLIGLICSLLLSIFRGDNFSTVLPGMAAIVFILALIGIIKAIFSK
jgi:hypothetical protein